MRTLDRLLAGATEATRHSVIVLLAAAHERHVRAERANRKHAERVAAEQRRHDEELQRIAAAYSARLGHLAPGIREEAEAWLAERRVYSPWDREAVTEELGRA